MDERLPKRISFTILSGDKGFVEVERQLANTERKVAVINPHYKPARRLYEEIFVVETVYIV